MKKVFLLKLSRTLLLSLGFFLALFLCCSTPPPIGGLDAGNVADDPPRSDAQKAKPDKADAGSLDRKSKPDKGSKDNTIDDQKASDYTEPVDRKASDKTVVDKDKYERNPDLPAGQCKIDRDCQNDQVCDKGRCFANCVTNAVCFDGDKCDKKRRRCICDLKTCSKSGGFCNVKELCRTSCKKDSECKKGEKCIQGRCKDPNEELLPDGAPADIEPPKGRNENCSGKGVRCVKGLICVKATSGKAVCLLPCKLNTECKSPEKCAAGVLSNGQGLCGLIKGEGERCDITLNLHCSSGYRCRKSVCTKRTRVGVGDQCDLEHICNPKTLVCVSFGPKFGDLCLKTCSVSKPGSCPVGYLCLDPSGGKNGICLEDCKATNKCSHPYNRCNQISSGNNVCVPQGKIVNPVGGPCGGAYGTCIKPSTCQVLFKRSKIGVCTEPCQGTSCASGFKCLQHVTGAKKACYLDCLDASDLSCPKGMFCTPIKGAWVCAP